MKIPTRAHATRRRRFAVGVLLATVAQGLALIGAGPVAAATFTVNTADDVADGVCDATHCSLRDAIQVANATAGADTIAFGIPGPVPAVISPATALPPLRYPTTVDGTSQPGYTGTPVVQIDGGLITSQASGITIQAGAGDVTVRGLSITNFTRDGIYAQAFGGAVHLTAVDNHLGVDASGTVEQGNGFSGVALAYGVTDSRIESNVISGNGYAGVNLIDARRTVVVGNLIGTDVTGAVAVPNSRGVEIHGRDGSPTRDNRIGGPAAADANVISGNRISGLLFNVAATAALPNVVEGNLIGVARDGVSPLGNGGHGIETILGGTSAGSTIAGNEIAFNVKAGIALGPSISGHRITANGIHDNGWLGIDLGADNVVNAAANNGRVPPVVGAADPTGSVSGTVTGTAGGTVRVEAFASPACDGSGSGEGERYVGAEDVVLDGSGDGTFSIPAGGVSVGEVVTATATDGDGNTSEFSVCTTAAIVDLTLHVNAVDDTDDGSCNATHCSLREAILAANGSEGPDEIDFVLPGPGPHTIAPAAALPAVTQPVVIDAGTEPACAGVPGVVLDGTTAGGTGIAGLVLAGSGGSTVRGLVVADWSGAGISITSPDNVVQCNRIGTDPTGTLARGNERGISIVNGADNLVGGTGPGQGNLVSASDLQGIFVSGGGAVDNRIEGNFVGTDVTGTVALGNGAFGGVNVSGWGNTVGGSDPAARNLISGNTGDGVFLPIGSSGNTVEGNWIGVDVTGNAALPNTANGVFLNGAAAVGVVDSVVRGNVISGNRNSGVQLSGTFATGNTIEDNLIGVGADGVTPVRNGPATPASPDTGWGVLVNGPGNVVQRNLIANTGTGVQVGTTPTAGVNGVLISENSIADVARQGIDLGGDGVTPNDAGDSDEGANDLMNTPELTSATLLDGSVQIDGTMSTTILTDVHVELFVSSECGVAGTGEGESFVGALDVTTDGDGTAAIETTVEGLELGEVLTATATDPDGSTSEFSACVTVADAPAAPAEDRIAFSSNAAGSYDIWTIAPDGTDRRQVTSAAGTENHPTWSPDGTRIAYASGTAIEIVDQDGSGTPVVIHTHTTGSPSSLDWSPDGSEIVFSAGAGAASGSGFDVYAIGADGSGLRNLTLGDTVGAAVSQDGQPVWSPDGSRLGITRTWVEGTVGYQDVWVIDPTGAVAPQRLTTDGRSKTGLEWLPDGSALTYQDNGLKKVVVATATVASLAPGVGSFGTSWSRNAQRIAYAGNVTDLFVRTLEPASVVNVTDSGETVFYPEWYQAVGEDRPQIVAETGSLNERDAATRTLDIPVRLSFPSVDPVTVDWSVLETVAPGERIATVSSDLPAQAGSLVFPPGTTSATISLTILDDAINEYPEWVLVPLRNATNADIGGLLGMGWAAIGDNDPLPRVVPGVARVDEGDSGSSLVSIPVVLSAASGRTVTVSWATLETILATAGVDYEATSGVLTFPPGVTTAQVDVTVFGDLEPESDEIVFAGFAPTANALPGGFFGLGAIVIADDDS